jgi:hypothetical protein
MYKILSKAHAMSTSTAVSTDAAEHISMSGPWVLHRERGRQRIVTLVFAVYWVLIFEGALRKWVFPQLEEVFFFIRVPFLLVIYGLAFKHRLWPRPWPLLVMAYGFAALSILLIHFQILAGNYSLRYLLLAGYGWHNYFFYIPLAFLIAEQFSVKDLWRLMRHTLWIAIAVAPLIMWQFYSPRSAVVNLGSSLDEAHQFHGLGAALGFIRPAGTFTSIAGHRQFVASAIAMVLVLWLLPRNQRPVSHTILLAATMALGTMLAVSGSRGLVMHAGIVSLSAAIVGLITQRRHVVFRSIFLPAMLVTAALLLYPIVFLTGYEVFMTRWQNAHTTESEIFEYGIFSRALYELYGFANHFGDTPLIGYLLGLRGNAANRLTWVRLPKAAQEWTGYDAWAEDGWSQHIIELGPLFGLLFIFYRIGFTVWLGRKTIAACRRSGHPLPILLFGYVGIILLNDTITGQGSILGYNWLFVGFCLAACQLGRQNFLASQTNKLGHASNVFNGELYE